MISMPPLTLIPPVKPLAPLRVSAPPPILVRFTGPLISLTLLVIRPAPVVRIVTLPSKIVLDGTTAPPTTFNCPFTVSGPTLAMPESATLIVEMPVVLIGLVSVIVGAYSTDPGMICLLPPTGCQEALASAPPVPL